MSSSLRPVEYSESKANPVNVWQEDSSAKTCTECGGKWTLLNRKHHCR